MYALIAVFLLIAGVTVYLRLHSLGEPAERDIAGYGYIAHQLLAGERIYTDLWDHKPPGAYWPFVLAESIWGYESSSLIYIGIPFTLISLLFIYLLLKKLAGDAVALIGSAFWALASNSVHLQANESNIEVFLNTFTILGIWSFMKSTEGKDRFLILAGLLFAIATTFKMIVIFPVAAVCGYVVITTLGRGWTTRVKEAGVRLFVLLAPTVLIWAGIFLYFGYTGRFGDFHEAVFEYNRDYSGNMWSNIWRMVSDPKLLFNPKLEDIGVLPALSVAWLIFSRKEYGPLRRSFFILLFIGLLAEVASPGKFHPHYYQILIPMYVIMASLCIDDIYGRLKSKGLVLAKAAVVLLSLSSIGYLSYYQLSYLKKTPDQISKIKYGGNVDFGDVYILAKYIQKITGSCDTIYEWGAEPGLYYYSQRKSASGIFYVYPLIRGQIEGRNKRMMKVYNDLTAAPPAIIVWNYRFGNTENNVLSTFLESKYRPLGSFRGYEIYEYIDRRKDISNGKC